jgi:hypothetical protein
VRKLYKMKSIIIVSIILLGIVSSKGDSTNIGVEPDVNQVQSADPGLAADSTSSTEIPTETGSVPSAALTAASYSPWSYCAAENNMCSYPGTRIVSYGKGCQNYFYKLVQGAGNIPCNNLTFNDPRPGLFKHCSTASSTFYLAANQGGNICNYDYYKTLLIGYGSVSNPLSSYKYGPLSPRTCMLCNNNNFGPLLIGAPAPYRCIKAVLPSTCPFPNN